MQNTDSKVLFGFWVYLMTDCMLFGVLFATYAVLYHHNLDIFNLPYALAETLVILTSSFTSGLALLSGINSKRGQVLFWFGVTFLLGLVFITMEFLEFQRLIAAGHSWEQSAFLSAFFTLVGTHGLHISLGLFWMLVLLFPVWRHGLTPVSFRRLSCLKLYWHFLDLVWIFIFTFVYLAGGANVQP